MKQLAFAAAAIMAVLGLLHLAYTLHDFGTRPRYFSPKNAALLDAMRETRTALAPEGRDYWSGILGFNLSHSIGVLLFALLITLATAYQILWLQPALVVVGGLYVTISFRCWFRVPTISALVATGLMIAGWIT